MPVNYLSINEITDFSPGTFASYLNDVGVGHSLAENFGIIPMFKYVSPRENKMSNVRKLIRFKPEITVNGCKPFGLNRFNSGDRALNQIEVSSASPIFNFDSLCLPA
ncbi:MAG: hypothetical protein OXE78_03860 [Gammaproteobacteria bacterium]|nr:hypothetical protein [Gammaproteobacteria bacterium]